MKLLLTTPRLRLRQFEFSDADFIIQLLNTPGWIQYIGDRNVHSVEAAENYLKERIFKGYENGGIGFCMVERIEDNVPIGMCGMIKRDDLEAHDIGFALLPEFFGYGYALEAAQATMNYAQQTMGIQTILGITTPDNVSSIRLLEKIGLNFRKMIFFENEDLMLFSTEKVNSDL